MVLLMAPRPVHGASIPQYQLGLLGQLQYCFPTSAREAIKYGFHSAALAQLVQAVML